MSITKPISIIYDRTSTTFKPSANNCTTLISSNKTSNYRPKPSSNRSIKQLQSRIAHGWRNNFIKKNSGNLLRDIFFRSTCFFPKIIQKYFSTLNSQNCCLFPRNSQTNVCKGFFRSPFRQDRAVRQAPSITEGSMCQSVSTYCHSTTLSPPYFRN